MSTALLTLQLLVGLTLGQYAPQRLAGDPLPAAQESRVQAIAKQLRCAVCQGLSVADSPSSMARAQLEMVRNLVAEGKSDAEVRDYFIARYGEWVLLEPEVEGINLLVWLGPVVLVAGGLMLILRQMAPPGTPGQPAGESSPAAAAADADTEDAYLKAVRAETER
jgi:cytochrome c-type biogenesis protein CcmH